MLNFESDYVAGCHENILRAFEKTNCEILSGYGNDKLTEKASEKIKKACKAPSSTVEFVSGGTQANQLVIASLLEKHQGVISAATGHVALHENGAIELTGHKVIELSQLNGKLDINETENYLKTFYSEFSEQMVTPGMIYISQPTEFGTIYSLEELKKLRKLCDKYNMYLYADGARLGYALASDKNDVELSDLAKYTDAFYIGGTKVGALCGEAIVFKKGVMPKYFRAYKKHHGAMLAKNRLLSVQFDALFTDNLYLTISENAIKTSKLLIKVLKKHKIKFFIDSPTNQQFVILSKEKMKALSKYVKFSNWQSYDKNSNVVRFATSWATTQKDIEDLDKVFSSLE